MQSYQFVHPGSEYENMYWGLFPFLTDGGKIANIEDPLQGP